MSWDLTEYERMDDMGYRSDVHALFYTTIKEDLPVLKLFMDENYPKDLHDLEEISSNRIYGYEVVYEDVKWYSGYDDVKAFDAFKTKYHALLDEQEDGKKWKFEFIRIGEDTEDVECEQDDSAYVLSVSRRIECDY
tara:strand:- start:3609 stop:4016 length:408 start_codon:yes stop_codon:yes gene_type:complete